MKKQTIILLSVVVAVIVILGAIFLFHKDTPGIAGAWETETTVLGISAEEGETGKLQFYFYEDLTGKEVTIANGMHNERVFTYILADGELTFTYESGDVRKFPCTLEKDTMVLEQHHALVTYQRISDK